MRAALIFATAGLLLQVVLSSASLAQSQSRPEDRTVRKGDTIVFTVPAPHKLQLTGSAGGVQLPTAADIANLFTLTPPLPPTGIYNAGKAVTAKVKEDATVTTFRFTCGQHPDDMLSHPFTVAAKEGPERTFK